MSRLVTISSLLALATVGFAAVPIPNISPLGVTGAFGGCSADTTDYNSGGTITVDNWIMTVPKNVLVQFPTIWTPFRDLCGAGIDNYEVTIFGNVIGTQPTVGQIIVNAGFSVRSGVGYIDSIDVADGSFKLRGLDTKLRLNDPSGVFGKASNLAPFFPVDDENPSIQAFSGFPMCFPRSSSDAKCPSSNRPAGSTNFAAPDPLAMVPFLVGDFITYTALPKNGELLVFEASATNVQVTTTASDTVPNYIFVEDAIIGVSDPAANVEIADTRFIGYLSSCNGASVQVFAIEVDPCTGDENLRQVGSATPRAGDVRCKWEARVAASTPPYTREYVIKTNNPVIETKDGIQAGQYVTPVTEWIQPEVDIPGTEPVPYRFSDMRGLVQGDFLDGQRFGPLSPFPGPNPPAPSKTCGTSDPTGSPAAPTAFIAPFTANQRGGATIQLVVQNNNTDLSNSQLNFNWTQIAPTVPSASATIQNPAQPTATFVAPKLTSSTALKFECAVSLKSNTSIVSKAQVTITVSPTASDIVTLDTYTWESRQSGTIGVTCHSNVANGDNKAMTLALNNNATRLVMSSLGSGRWSYSSNKVKQPTNVQCYSDLGGKSALLTAPTKRRRRGVLGMILE